MQLWAEIRRRVKREELSKRAACREYGFHWKMLDKILRHTEPPGYRLSKRRPSKRAPLLDVIHRILEEDKKAPRKQRHTGQRIFERLRDEEGYEGGISIVRDAIRRWKHKHKEAFLPLKHPPGEAQVDFGFAKVVLNGEETQVALFVMTLVYSDALFCQAFPQECTEVFLEGHRRAFEFFVGVPTRISYDNSKIAVAQIVGSRERKITREFCRLKSHYLFEDHFCLVRRPNEKGHVETLIKFAQSNYLVPVPSVESLEQLNRHLLERCQKDLQRQVRGQSASKQELLEEERTVFLSLPWQSFEARRLEQRRADSLSLVRFDSNSYSAPTRWAHRSINVVATVDEIRLIHEDELVAKHRRHWGKEECFYNPVHYLELLEKKPGGFDFAKPLESWDLPISFGVLRRRLESEFGSQGKSEAREEQAAGIDASR